MQIIAFLFLILAFVLIFSIKEGLSKKAKITLFSILLGVSVLAFLYEQYTNATQSRYRQIINAYNQGKVITCKGVKVDKKRFNFENGTQSFIAKKEFKELSGTIIPISQCDL